MNDTELRVSTWLGAISKHNNKMSKRAFAQNSIHIVNFKIIDGQHNWLKKHKQSERHDRIII